MPDNYNGVEHYAHFYNTGWNDSPLTSSVAEGFIVEIENAAPLTAPAGNLIEMPIYQFDPMW